MVFASIQRSTYEEVTTPVKHSILRGYNKYDIEQGEATGETTALFFTSSGITSTSSPRQIYCPVRRLDARHNRLTMGIFALGVIFVVGVTVGTYLLLEQGRPLLVPLPFELVERDFWGAKTMPILTSPLNPTNVSKVVVSQTHSSPCLDTASCVKVVRELQKQSNLTSNSDIPYNFLIGGDGQTYEALGWRYESGLDNLPVKSNALTIAFIGDFTDQLPSYHQLAQAQALINESINRKKLSSSYKIYGIRNKTISDVDGAALFEHIAKKWQRWHHMIDVDVDSPASVGALM